MCWCSDLVVNLKIDILKRVVAVEPCGIVEKGRKVFCYPSGQSLVGN